jgi:regulatory protein
MKIQNAREAREKIQQYCAYQERCHQEVRNKLYEYGLHRNDVDEILSELITDGFLNEERFAKAFAGGKFRMKKWGRIKITNALQMKGVSSNCILLALKEIDESSYCSTLRELLAVKSQLLEPDNDYIVRDRLSRYAIRKGYEPEMVWQQINDLMPTK